MKSKFQQESTKSGKEYEDVVTQHLQQRGLKIIERNYKLEWSNGKRVGELDILTWDPKRRHYVIIECKGGKSEKGKMPGAKRQDNVRKAIGKMICLKNSFKAGPDGNFSTTISTDLVDMEVYFSAPPGNRSYSRKDINYAIALGQIDRVTYLDYDGNILDVLDKSGVD